MNSYVVNLYPVPNDGFPGEVLAVTNAAAFSFTTAFDYKTTCALVTITGNGVYVTFDGTTPSSANGNLLASGYTEYVSKESARVAKYVAISGTNARVAMTQFTY